MTCHVAAILVRCIASQARCRVCNQHGRRCALDIIAAVGVPSAPSGDFTTDRRSVSIGELCVGNQPAEPSNLDQPRDSLLHEFVYSLRRCLTDNIRTAVGIASTLARDVLPMLLG